MNIGLHLTNHRGTVYHVAIVKIDGQMGILSDMYDWCSTVFGKTASKHDTIHRWYYSIGQFWFRDEHDRTLFMLRWA